jgi:hypothetical protein
LIKAYGNTNNERLYCLFPPYGRGSWNITPVKPFFRQEIRKKWVE